MNQLKSIFSPILKWWERLKNRVKVLSRAWNINVLDFLCKHNFGVSYHESQYVQTVDCSDPTRQEDIKTDRFVFEVSYIHRKTVGVDERWYYSTRSGRRLFILSDHHEETHRLEYRAELKSFFAHFSPRMRQWVHKSSPVVQGFYTPEFSPCTSEPTKPVLINTYRCDFSQCRYAFSFSFDRVSGLTSEVLQQSYKALKRSLTNQVITINKILTGADNDGEMMSSSNMPMCENLLCRHCGLPVFASPRNKYHFECLRCGELIHAQVDRVDPVRYERVRENTLEELEYLTKRVSAGL